MTERELLDRAVALLEQAPFAAYAAFLSTGSGDGRRTFDEWQAKRDQFVREIAKVRPWLKT